ncbi:hypothetical protein ABIE13_005617 [Ottowia thiooxydans]|uniref:Uncharacterized protein n=1 Tax=Ottowia thiooxydans TaxID=219182 RepID=A0ABV2QHF0_9BURK
MRCSNDGVASTGRTCLPKTRNSGRSAGRSFVRSATVVAVAYILTRGLVNLVRNAPVISRGPGPAEPVGTGNEPPVGGAIFD